jgi:hypothetical protein
MIPSSGPKVHFYYSIAVQMAIDVYVFVALVPAVSCCKFSDSFTGLHGIPFN